MHSVNQEILKLVKDTFPIIGELKLQEEIATVGQLLHFKQGDQIIDYGRHIRMVPLVIKGSIKVIRHDKGAENGLFLYFLNSGDTCSMSFSCCMKKKVSNIRAIAEDEATLIGIPIEYVDQWMMKYRTWKSFIMTSYDQRLQELANTIDNIVFQKLDERLLDYLKKKALANSSNIIHTTHQDIAQDLNASREGISRILKQFEKKEQIILGRNKIELL